MTTCLDNLPSLRGYSGGGGGSVLPLTVGGIFFRKSDNTIHRYKGVTGFRLCNLFELGQDIDKFLSTFNRSNTVRIFWYTPQKEWGDKYWDLPTATDLIAFHNYVEGKGFYVENTCATDNDTSKVPGIKNLITILNQANLPNVLYEAVNEPYVKGPDDKLDPAIFKNLLNASPYPYTSGIYQYEFLDKFYGKYAVDHSPRDADWPRKAKDLEDYVGQFKIPAIQDEPIKPNDAGFNVLDYYTYGAASGLFGSGCLFHYLAGEFGQLPASNELDCYNAMMDGLDIFPLDACLGQYEHLRDMEKCDANGDPTTCLRVFRKGSYAIIIRNKSVVIPSNWQPLDSFQVCFKIG